MDAAEVVGVHEADEVLVEDIAGPDVLRVGGGEDDVVWSDGFGEAFDEFSDFGGAVWVAGSAADAGDA